MREFEHIYRGDDVAYFFENVLTNAISYRRCVGYFSSSAFHSWGLFIMDLFSKKSDLKVELLISPNLSSNDIKAIQNAYVDERENFKKLCEDEVTKLVQKMINCGQSSIDDFSVILSWLIYFKKIDIKIAFPLDIGDTSLYHSKMGYVEYANGALVFSGSANETLSGHHRNKEIVHVYVKDQTNGYDDVKAAIDADWEGKISGDYVVERLSRGNMDKLKSSIESLNANFTTKDIEVKNGKVRVKRKLVEGKKEIVLRDHQSKAVHDWIENKYRGIFSMCTGAGKTIAALAAVKKLDEDIELTSVVILCPTNILVNQWRDEVISFLLDDYRFNKPLDSENINFKNNIREWLGRRNSPKSPNIIITTNASFCMEHFSNAIKFNSRKKNLRTLLIADEVHTCGAKQIKKKLNENVIAEFFKWRLGMSATYEREDDYAGTEFIRTYFGNEIAEFSIKDGIYGKKPCLCEYNYYPIIQRLDGRETESFWRLIGDESKKENADLITQRNASIKALSKIFGEHGHISSLAEAQRTVCFTPMGSDENGNLLEKSVECIRELLPDVRVTNVEESGEVRAQNIENFRSGKFEIMVAMKIFDEGVNIPEIENAVMMYSYNRERQFIQRRGRVLRQCQKIGKEYANIYDIILLPDSGMPDGKKEELLNKEIRRYLNFCVNARNGVEAKKFIEKNLDMDMRYE